MDSDGTPLDWAYDGNTPRALHANGRLLIAGCDDASALLDLKARLLRDARGRRLWLLWTWLLLLAGGTVTVEGSFAVIVLAVFVIVLFAIVSFVVRVRDRAERAEAWLADVDFRLMQLASRT